MGHRALHVGRARLSVKALDGSNEERRAGICRQLIAGPHDGGVAVGDLVTDFGRARVETHRACDKIAAAIVDGYQQKRPFMAPDVDSVSKALNCPGIVGGPDQSTQPVHGLWQRGRWRLSTLWSRPEY